MKKHFYKQDIINVCENKHLTVDEIFCEINSMYPNCWKSSIYRNVKELTEEWKLKKVLWAWNKAYYEKSKWNHIHLIDSKTWKIIDLDVEKIDIPWIPEWFEVEEMDIKLFWKFVK